MMKSSQQDEPEASGSHRVPPPRISIVIPTKNGAGLLSRCINSIREKSTYADYEIVIVDNGSTDSRALRLLDGLRWSAKTKVVKYPGRFNFSAMINRGAAAASGAILCLLNNDTEVISPDWMETMEGHLAKEGVGVVGALLLFPDGSIQHAGDMVGGGSCVRHDHGEGWMKGGSIDSCTVLPECREVDAVTGACLMTRRDLFLRLGGMDEQAFPVAFNDTDFCLQVRQSGWRVICALGARLLHHELATRGPTWKPWDLWRLHREKMAFRKRWLDKGFIDPFTTIPS
jgi:GT2 family glycosyltransferase